MSEKNNILKRAKDTGITMLYALIVGGIAIAFTLGYPIWCAYIGIKEIINKKRNVCKKNK